MRADTGAPAPGTGTLPSDDLAAAQAFMKPLTVGLNVERGWAWDVPGGPSAEAQYLVGLGVTHVRLFFPWSPSLDFGLGKGEPSAAQIATFFDAVNKWIAGGVTVFVDATDMITPQDFTDSKAAIYAEVTAVAAAAAARHFPKEKFAIGPINEWVGDDGNGGDPFVVPRKELHDILRAALPGYVLTESSEYWDYYKNLLKLTPSTDQRTIYSFHCYDTQSASGWSEQVKAPLTAWSKQHGGLPILWGEAGPGDPRNASGWPANIADIASEMAVFRPTFWAITYGGELSFGKSASDATLQDGTNGTVDLKGAVVAAGAAAKTALAGNNGAP